MGYIRQTGRLSPIKVGRVKRDWLQLTFNALMCLGALGTFALFVDALY